MSDLISRHQKVIAPVIAFDTDVVAERAAGIWVYDSEGRRFADFACGTAVVNLGHNHPAVVEAAHRQIDRFIHSGCIFRYDSLVQAAEMLAELTPPAIEKFGFANSGSEAVEGVTAIVQNTTPYTYFASRPIELAEDVALDDGTLGGVVLSRASVLDMPTVTWRALSPRARILKHRRVASFAGAETVTIRSLDERPLPLQVDGDYLGDFEQFELRADPAALRVVA